MNRKPLRFLRYIGILLCCILALLLVWAAVHQIVTASEKKRTRQIGRYVSVSGKQMNVYVAGDGACTIVLMPGLGTAAPALDFMPLIDALSTEYRVVIAEPFGYGWSDLTDAARTVQNIVEEQRAALKEAGISGPYILMPHSISGVYATYYANTYPDEIAAIIGIDCTLPRQVQYFGGSSVGSVPSIAKLAAPLGLSRLITMLAPDTFLSDNTAGCYSAGNLTMQRKIAAWKGYNRNVVEEMNTVDSNIAATLSMTFDPALPLLFFTRLESSRTPHEDGKTSVGFYESYITNPACQKVVELDGRHYLHWNCSSETANAVQAFLVQNHLSK